MFEASVDTLFMGMSLCQHWNLIIKLLLVVLKSCRSTNKNIRKEVLAMTIMINNKLIVVLIIMGTVTCDVIIGYVKNTMGSNLFSWIRPP